MRKYYKRSFYWFCTLTLISLLKVFMAIVVIGALFSQQIFSMIVQESILVFFSLIILGNILLEVFFDQRLSQQLMSETNQVGIIAILGVVQLIIAIPLFLYVSLHGNNFPMQSFVYQLIFCTFAAVYTIYWKSVYFKTRQDIYLWTP